MGTAHQKEEEMTTSETKDILVKINGKTFRCDCRANVFRWVAHERLKCNGCGAIYEAIKEDPGKVKG